ncbi:MAG: DNA glycosylase [Actinomycetota bacterium]|nr:DNA glycosylase [Actinomycetota bacterium]
MPEGDTLHRAARRLHVLVGEHLEIEAPHQRAQAARVAGQLNGRRLESVEAIGKNLLFRFEGGVVLRSHLRMSGRWAVQPRGREPAGRPWLVLRGTEAEGVLWGGPVLELHARALEQLGPDILGSPPDFDAMLARIAAADGGRRLGETLQDQSLVAGIGNMWMAETLWQARLSPWLRLRDVTAAERRKVLETAAGSMRAAVEAGREPRKQVHGRAGRPCPRCRMPIRALGQGDDARTAYWCPACQVGDVPSAS